MAKKKRTPPRQTPAERSDALALLTDDDVRAALQRRRDQLIQWLADQAINKMMPDWDTTAAPVQRESERQVRVFRAAILDIDRRLAGAAKLLRAYGPVPDSDEGVD